MPPVRCTINGGIALTRGALLDRVQALVADAACVQTQRLVAYLTDLGWSTAAISAAVAEFAVRQPTRAELAAVVDDAVQQLRAGPPTLH